MGRSSDRRGSGAALAAAIILCCGGCASGAKNEPFLLHPVPQAVTGYALTAGAVLYTDKDLEAEVRPLDPLFLERELAAKGKANPIAFPAGAPRTIVFAVRVSNLGKDVVYFNPATARGLDDLKQRYLPVTYTDLFQIFREDADGRAKLRAFEETFLDRPLEIRPGGKAEGYLAFMVPGETPVTLGVTLPFTLGGLSTRSPNFLFEAFPAGKTPAKP